MSYKVKIPAKINLSLDVTGAEKGYHTIDTLVASVNVYDEITLKKRKDYNVSLTEKNILSGCPTEKNNAFIAASLFMNTYNTTGVDITIKKNIPIGNGLGGSSADIAGVLKGMQKLYKTNGSILPLANSLGSDSGYMVYGGFAVLKGRGDVVEKVESRLNLFLLLLTGKEIITAKECYNGFDKIAVSTKKTTRKATDGLICGEYETLINNMDNDLYLSSKEILPDLEERIKDLKSAGADNAVMTGSGSCVFGVFKTKKERDNAYKKLFGKYKESLIKAKTVNR